MKILKYFFLILIIYLAISLSVSRLLIFYIDDNPDFFQDLISKKSAINLQIKTINSNWKGIYPSIETEISYNDKNSQLNYIGRIQLQVNIYKSIIFLKPVIKSIYADNIKYTGNIINLIAENSKSKRIDGIIVESIVIENSEFYIWHNKNKFELKNTNILVDKNNISISSNLDEDKKIIIAIRDLEIKNNKVNKASYKAEIQGDFNYKLENFFNNHDLKINGTNLFMKINGEYENNNFTSSKILIKTIGESLIYFNDSLFKDINLKVAFSGDIKNKFNFEIIEFYSKSKSNSIYKFNNISVSYENNKKMNIYANNISIDTKKIFKDYNFIKKNNFNFIGNVKNLKVIFFPNKSSNKFFLSGNFQNSSFFSNTSYVKNFSGFISIDDYKAYINSNSNDIEILNNAIINKKLSFDNVKGEISISNFISPDINLSNIKILNNQLDLSISGNIDKQSDSISIFTTLNYVDMRYVTDYFPKNFITKKTSKYFSKAFLKGQTNNGYVFINGRLSKYPFYDDYSGISYAVFPIKDLKVDYKKGWIPFDDISGIAYFKKREAHFISNSFEILDSEVSKSSLYIKNVKSAELLLKGDLKGPLKDLLIYSNKAGLSKVEKNNINKIKGSANTEFNIKLAFNGNDNYYESQIQLNNINYSANESYNFKKIKGIVKFKNNNFYTEDGKFIEAFYNNLKVKFKLNTDENGNFILSGNQNIKLNKYIENKNFKNYISGKSNWNYKINIPSFNSTNKSIKVLAKSKLDGTEINLPEPFKKKKNIRSKTVISALYKENEFNDISITYNGIYSRLMTLDSLNGYIDFSGKIHNMPNNKLNIFGNIDTVNINEWKKINGEKKSNINYLQYINTININVSKLISDKIILDNFHAKGFSSDNAFTFNELTSSSDNFNIKASGDVENNNVSSFKIYLKSNNLENLLNYWNFTHSLRDSSLDSNFDITWKGNLFDFSLNKVYGNFSTNMKDGRIKKVGNRVTRIFGLFNIDLLAKRLSLDFDDVTKNGFYYNTLDGDFRIDSGSIFTTNLFVKGPSAELLAVGTTDIINETYDMQVVASPEFGETLPAIALLGGPITAAATFAAEKLAKAFGKDINDLIKIRYKVSGSWDNPVIKVIGRKNDPLDDVQELLQ